MRVLVACEFSGIVREAFARGGHEAMSCDLLPTELTGNHYQGDVRDVLDYPWDLMIAHPPCTHLSVSGAKHFKEKRADGRQQSSASFFMLLAKSNIPMIAIENPISIVSSLYRKPDQIIQPWQHGHGETKATCLWLKRMPLLKPSSIVDVAQGRIVSITVEGEMYCVLTALDGWCECFADIAKAMNATDYNDAPLRSMMAKLNADMPLTLKLVQQAKAVVDAQRKLYMLAPHGVINNVANALLEREAA
jgi:hypothetical protein